MAGYINRDWPDIRPLQSAYLAGFIRTHAIIYLAHMKVGDNLWIVVWPDINRDCPDIRHLQSAYLAGYIRTYPIIHLAHVKVGDNLWLVIGPDKLIERLAGYPASAYLAGYPVIW